MRQIRENVEALALATKTVGLGDKQYFCELPKSWELWGTIGELPYRLRRWPKDRILFVLERNPLEPPT